MEAELYLVENWEDAQSFMAWLGERRPILGCDTETGGFDWWRHALRTVQFGDLGSGWVIPWEQGGWGALAKDALKRYTGDIVFHNLKFDLHFLEVNGVKLRHDRLHDTGTMAQLLYPGKSWALKKLGAEFIDGAIDQAQTDLKKIMAKQRYTWATVPIELPSYWAYSALDPVITAHLYEEFRPQLTGKLADLYELEIACTLIIAEMERRGARVDIEYCKVKRDELLTFAEEMRAWVLQEYGFSVGSHKQVAAQLQRDGVVLHKKTAEGAWSVDESVLSSVDHPLAKDVLAVRRPRSRLTATSATISSTRTGRYPAPARQHDGGPNRSNVHQPTGTAAGA